MMHSVSTRRVFAAVAALSVLLAAPLASALDAFLQIEGAEMKGDSKDKDFRDAIEIDSFSFGVQNTGASSPGAGRGRSAPNFTELSVQKSADSASTYLFMAAANGTLLKSVTLSLKKSGGDKGGVFYKVTLKDAQVASVQTSAAPKGDAVPTESVTFSFASIIIEYTAADPKGGPGKKHTFSWDTKNVRQ
ncbi:MAG: type VI secretion system tube protein Hcp [Polyangiaceae bacterium]|nr:type VI secretion system tube protein Hcp [Polyangiaceae bacterium]